MKFAAIDIGSNAVRLLIKKVIKEKGDIDSIKVSYTRVPIRLGGDVFTKGEISKEKQTQIVKTIKAFKHLMDVQSIKYFRACATSAMREAKNKKEVVKLVEKETKIKLDVISGEEEANLIISNFVTQDLEKQSVYLYIDVGGGSTELSIIKKGKKGKGASFKIGTVRSIEKKVDQESWDELKEYCLSLKKKYKAIKGIGTGGNINRIFKESRRKTFENISFKEIEQIKEYIQSFSMKDRVRLLKLKPDRADVIIPAAKIYLFVMKHTGIKELIVPRIGLSDGIIYDLYQRTMAE
ncbi:MAG: exopolyphosphatase [Flavobacteriales bacterium]|nr:exopolyphosphatase [Flavobacteriales bacterium]